MAYHNVSIVESIYGMDIPNFNFWWVNYRMSNAHIYKQKMVTMLQCLGTNGENSDENTLKK